MFGFPNETEEDVIDLAKFIKHILKTRDRFNKNLYVDFKISPAIPGPHTPLQWEPFDINKINYKIGIFMEELSDLNLEYAGSTELGVNYLNYDINVRIDFNSNDGCLKEYVLFCGNDETGEFIMNNDFNAPISEWEKYLPIYNIGDELPWDYIDLGYRDSFIPREYKKMLKFKTTPCVRKILVSIVRITVKEIHTLKMNHKIFSIHHH